MRSSRRVRPTDVADRIGRRLIVLGVTRRGRSWEVNSHVVAILQAMDLPPSKADQIPVIAGVDLEDVCRFVLKSLAQREDSRSGRFRLGRWALDLDRAILNANLDVELLSILAHILTLLPDQMARELRREGEGQGKVSLALIPSFLIDEACDAVRKSPHTVGRTTKDGLVGEGGRSNRVRGEAGMANSTDTDLNRKFARRKGLLLLRDELPQLFIQTIASAQRQSPARVVSTILTRGESVRSQTYVGGIAMFLVTISRGAPTMRSRCSSAWLKACRNRLTSSVVGGLVGRSYGAFGSMNPS